MKHFLIDIDGEVFDPSYTQYVIETKLPDHSLGKPYSSPHGTLKPERVKPIIKQTLLTLSEMKNPIYYLRNRRHLNTIVMEEVKHAS